MVRMRMPDAYDLKPQASRLAIGRQHGPGIELIAIPGPLFVKIGRLSDTVHPDPLLCLLADKKTTGLIRVARLRICFDTLKEILGYINNIHRLIVDYFTRL